MKVIALLKKATKKAVKGANNLRRKIQPKIKPTLCFIGSGLKKGANNLRKKLQSKVRPALRFIWKVFKKLVKIDIIFLIIGIIINSIICKIFHKFPDNFPIIYGWFDGWVQFNLFIVKSLVNGVYAISEGNWTEYRYEFHNTFHKMVIHFVEWVNNIKVWFFMNLLVLLADFFNKYESSISFYRLTSDALLF